ncbi:MAG: hypothetical protein ACHQAY_13685 [Hyphomicrobiales bacterium]
MDVPRMHWADVHSFGGFLDYLHEGGAALGTVVTAFAAITAYLARPMIEGVIARLRHAHRVSEMLRAIDADINRIKRNYEQVFGAEREAQLAQRFDVAIAANVDHIPFSSTIGEDAIFSVVKGELDSLSGDLIELVVDYFENGELISQSILDMRTASFKELEIGRKKAYALNLFEIARDRLQVAEQLRWRIRDRAYWRRLITWLLAVALFGTVASAVIVGLD